MNVDAHAEVRQEAVQQALALAAKNKAKPAMPMPSRRTSVMAKSPTRERRRRRCGSDTSSDDDSVANCSSDTQDRSGQSRPFSFGQNPSSDTSMTDSSTTSSPAHDQIIVPPPLPPAKHPSRRDRHNHRDHERYDRYLPHYEHRDYRDYQRDSDRERHRDRHRDGDRERHHHHHHHHEHRDHRDRERERERERRDREREAAMRAAQYEAQRQQRHLKKQELREARRSQHHVSSDVHLRRRDESADEPPGRAPAAAPHSPPTSDQMSQNKPSVSHSASQPLHSQHSNASRATGSGGAVTGSSTTSSNERTPADDKPQAPERVSSRVTESVTINQLADVMQNCLSRERTNGSSANHRSTPDMTNNIAAPPLPPRITSTSASVGTNGTTHSGDPLPDYDTVFQQDQHGSQDRLDETVSINYDTSTYSSTGTNYRKVSAKIQQLLNTLKRPKKKPIGELSRSV